LLAEDRGEAPDGQARHLCELRQAQGLLQVLLDVRQGALHSEQGSRRHAESLANRRETSHRNTSVRQQEMTN
jgi:hypothetical protein